MPFITTKDGTQIYYTWHKAHGQGRADQCGAAAHAEDGR